MPKSKLLCNGCNADIIKIKELGYIVNNDVWKEAAPANTLHCISGYFLCISCLENRIKRRLIPADFPEDLPINWPEMYPRSARLSERLGHTPTVIPDHTNTNNVSRDQLMSSD